MIPLESAYLCLDEDLLFDGYAGPVCPRCGSCTVWPIARWLNRPAAAAAALTIRPAELLALAEASGLEEPWS